MPRKIRSNYREKFKFVYNGKTFESKRQCCKVYGICYRSVMSYQNQYKCNTEEAITHFKVIERFPKYNCTLLEIKIETGRTHQIRVHLSEIGYPVIGDEVYSNGKNQWNIKGQCLHAKSLKFKHPVTKKEMFIEAELPKYFKDIIEQMRQRGTGL